MATRIFGLIKRCLFLCRKCTSINFLWNPSFTKVLKSYQKILVFHPKIISISKKLKKLFNVKKLIGINKKIDNIFECPSPYWYLVNRSDNNSNNSQKNMVVFFGNDMEGVLGFGVSSKDQYVSRVNECLDYIRQNFIGFDLCYKSHPGDAGEQNYLNLAGFRILDVKITAEIFMADNLKKLRA